MAQKSKTNRTRKSAAPAKKSASAAHKVWELQNILNSIAAPMFVTDADLLITWINDPALKVAGYTREEVVGKMTCAQISKTPLCGTENCTIKNCMSTRQQIIGETEIETRDGRKVPIAATCSAIFDEAGNPCGGMEVIVDRSAAVEAAWQMENITKSIAAPMFVTDANLLIQSINDAALKASGYSREEVVGKMTCAELAKTPLCGTNQCTIKNCMRTHEVIHGETVMETRDGRKVPIIAACSALFDRDDKPYGGVEVIVDQTEQKDTMNEVRRLMEAANRGDLTARATLGSASGDYKMLREGVNELMAAFETAIRQVAEAAEQVAAASTQISTGSQSLAQGASEQAGSLEEISSSLEQMSSMTKQNAENADQAKLLANDARQSSDKGDAAMKRMKEAIEKIKTSSDQTAKILKTIDEIAFQTNLLALNAAVEAARAGEAGKGFAVVAEEVRNLAQRSAEAAKNTANMIEESVANANNGVKISEEVANALAEIADGASKVNDLVAEIAAASSEQAQGIGEINGGVGQLDKVTQSNAAAAEESASASEELNSQAEELRGLVGTFKVSGQANLREGGRTAKAQSRTHRNHSDDWEAEERNSAAPVRRQAPGEQPARSLAEEIIPLDEKELATF